MIEPIIKVTNLTKTFGSKTAVNDLSFEVNPGEIFAFLGAKYSTSNLWNYPHQWQSL